MEQQKNVKTGNIPYVGPEQTMYVIKSQIHLVRQSLSMKNATKNVTKRERVGFPESCCIIFVGHLGKKIYNSSTYFEKIPNLNHNALKTAQKTKKVIHKCFQEFNCTSISMSGFYIFKKNVKFVVKYCTIANF